MYVGSLKKVMHEGIFSFVKDKVKGVGDSLETRAVKSLFDPSSNPKDAEYSFSFGHAGNKPGWGPWTKNINSAFRGAAKSAKVKLTKDWYEQNKDQTIYFNGRSKQGEGGAKSAKLKNVVAALNIKI